MDIHTPLFNNRSLVGHLREMESNGITSVSNFLTEHTRTLLLRELEAMDLKEAEKEVGPYKIKQSYRFTTEFHEDSLYRSVQSALETQLNSTCKAHLPTHLSKPLHFGDLVVQQYDPTEVGISPHRDGRGYMNIIAVFVLDGRGRFCICDNREGDHPREIRNEPGDLLLMRAPGLAGEVIQPFHFVDQIETQRTSFALRHKGVFKAS